MLLRDGTILAMGLVRGVPHELASGAERNSAARLLNHLWTSIGDDNIAVHATLVRDKVDKLLPEPNYSNHYIASLSGKYRELVLRGRLYSNDWYMSLLVSPKVHAGGRAAGGELIRMLTNLRRYKSARVATVEAIEDLWLTVARRLDGYQITRLGERTKNDIVYSEIAEAARRFLYVDFQAVGKVRAGSAIGEVLYNQRVHFPAGDNYYWFDTEHGKRYGQVIGLKQYMEHTKPGMLDELLALPMRLVMSQSMAFLAKNDAVEASKFKGRQMIAAGDPAISDIQEIMESTRDIGRGQGAKATHHLSIAFYGDTHAELLRNAGAGRRVLADTGGHPRIEELGNMAAYYAQLPGNLEWRTTRWPIHTHNFAHLASFGGFPPGAPKGRWGAAPIQFRTAGGTLYDWQPHAGISRDVAMTAFYGPIGSGKTAVALFIMGMLDPALTDPSLDEDGIAFLLDKDRGGELFAHAIEGNYGAVRLGEWTGAAPLKGLNDIPADRQFLTRFLRGLIAFDRRGPLPPEDDIRLPRAVKLIMRLPPELRSIAGLCMFLGHVDQMGAGPRLRRWARGEELGWVFDGERDESAMSRFFGRDLTEVLDNPEIVTPLALYYMHRLRAKMDGRRIVMCLDECKAYLLHDIIRFDIDDLIRRGRKNELMIMLITQQPEDLLEGSFGVTVTQQIQNKFFFQNPEASWDTYCGVINCTEGEYRAIREGLLPRQVLLKRGSTDEGRTVHRSVILDFDLSLMGEELAILSGRAKSVRRGAKIRAKYALQADGTSWQDEFKTAYREAAE
jgi:type IV secretion system protein VirB4